MRRQAPLAYDTRIAFPQDVVQAQQVQVDVFAKIGTDTIVIDPRTELYDLNIGGDSEGFSGLALRVRPQAEGATPGLRRRLEDAQATEDYIEQHDLRHFASQVVPGSSQQLRAPPRQLLGAPSESDPGDAASVTTEERLQKARQDAAEYVERFDLRQVLQNMFQRVIRERPEDPFGFMQAFLSSGSVRPWAVASVEADAAAEEMRHSREQEQAEKLATSQRLLEEAQARVRELETGGAEGGPGSGEALARERAETAAQVEKHVKHIEALEQQLREAEAKNAAFPLALEQAKRRDEEHQHQMTLTKAQVSAQSQRVETLEQQLKDARRAAESAQQDSRKHVASDSPSADSDAAAAAVHEAAAARDAAVARELAAAAAAVQEASVSRDAAVKRELATLKERTDLQRRCGDFEHNVKALEKKMQLLEKKSGMSVTDREAGVEPRTPAGSGQAPAASELAGAAEKLEAERRAHQETQEKCREAERRLEEAKQRCGELERSHGEATERYAELQRSQQQAGEERQGADRRSAEEKRFAEAVRQYGELEEQHKALGRRCAEAELQRSELQKQVDDMQCQMQEAEDAAAAAAVLEGVLPELPERGLPEVGATAEPGGGESRELKQLPPGPGEEAAAAEPEQRALKQTPPEDGGDTTQEVRILSERVEVERRCHEQALLECRELQRKKQTVERQKTELEARLASAEAASQASRDSQSETCKMLERRVQELEASVAAAASTASAQQTELSRSYEMQLENQNTRIEVLQRRIQAYEAFGVACGDGAAGAASQASPRGDAAAGGSRGSAKKVGLEGTGPQRPAYATASTMPPPTASTASLPAPAATFGASGSGEVNTHMLSHLLASSYAPPVPPTTYLEPREDQEVEPGQPDPSLLVEVVDCKDVLSNGVFAWVGVCNLRPLYRLLGPEPRYLYYAEADIASNWRIVNKMGSEEYVERFRKPTDAKLPVECEKGDAGSGVFEVKLTVDVIQRISMIDSQDEKVAIRSRLAEAYGQKFVALEGRGRGLVSKASPVVAVAHALESQQRALQLLHGQLSVETQRREAAEQHSLTMQQAFETLQLRIQAQLPGPPSVASLQEVQAAISGQNARAFAEKPASTSPPVSQDRGLVFEQDGKADWAPDLGPGCGPVPHPPIEPKDRKPVPPPTFRRGPVGLRNSKCSPRPVAYPVATGAPRPDDWSPDPLEPLPESPAEAPVVAVE